MPFEIADFESLRDYQARLKVEAAKVGDAGQFAVFEKVKFGDGKTRTAMLVGKRRDVGLEKFLKTNGAKVKAEGTCVWSGTSLTLAVDSGNVNKSEISPLGLKVAVAGEEEDENSGQTNTTNEPETVESGEDVPGEDTGPSTTTTTTTTTGGGFQRATPSHNQPQGNMQIGTGRREGIQKFIEQRQGMLELAREYVESMEYFRGRAQSLINQAASLINRAEGGEKSEPLKKSLETALTAAVKLRELSRASYDEQGQKFARERQVNPSTFDLEGSVAAMVLKKTKKTFDDAVKISAEATKIIREVTYELDQLIPNLELAQSLAQGDRVQVNDLVKCLDGMIAGFLTPLDAIEKNYLMSGSNETIRLTLADPRVTNEILTTTLNTNLERIQVRTEILNAAMARLTRGCSNAIKRLQQGPTDHPELQDRRVRITEIMQRLNQMNREFQEGVQLHKTYEAQARERLGGG